VLQIFPAVVSCIRASISEQGEVAGYVQSPSTPASMGATSGRPNVCVARVVIILLRLERRNFIDDGPVADGVAGQPGPRLPGAPSKLLKHGPPWLVRKLQPCGFMAGARSMVLFSFVLAASSQGAHAQNRMWHLRTARQGAAHNKQAHLRSAVGLLLRAQGHRLSARRTLKRFAKNLRQAKAWLRNR